MSGQFNKYALQWVASQFNGWQASAMGGKLVQWVARLCKGWQASAVGGKTVQWVASQCNGGKSLQWMSSQCNLSAAQSVQFNECTVQRKCKCNEKSNTSNILELYQVNMVET